MENILYNIDMNESYFYFMRTYVICHLHIYDFNDLLSVTIFYFSFVLLN